MDVERPRIEGQHLSWCHQPIAGLRVVPEEELEPGVLDGISRNVAAIRFSLHPRRPPAVHIDHNLYPRIDADAIGVVEHVAGEAVHDEHFRRQRVGGHEGGEEINGLIHVRGVEASDSSARGAAVTHRELRIQAKVNVGPAKKRDEARQLGLQRATAKLNVKEEKGVATARPAVYSLDQSAVRSLPVLAVATGRTLRDDRDEVKCRLRWCGGIGGAPLGCDAIQSREHRVNRLQREYTHPTREGIAIEGNDAARGEDRAGQRIWWDRPTGLRIGGSGAGPRFHRMRWPLRAMRHRVWLLPDRGRGAEKNESESNAESAKRHEQRGSAETD